jgi:hypothetical protein
MRRVDQGRPWSYLPDQENGDVLAFFNAATAAVLGNGESILFWTDSWIRGSSIRIIAPAVFEAVPKRKWGVTVAEALNNHNWVHHITGSRTVSLLTDFISLCRTLEQVHLSPGTPDTFV